MFLCCRLCLLQSLPCHEDTDMSRVACARSQESPCLFCTFQNYPLDPSELVCPCSAAARTCMSAAARETESQGHSGSCRDMTRKALPLARSLSVPATCPPSSTGTFTGLPNLCHLLQHSHASLPPTSRSSRSTRRGRQELRSKDTTARPLPWQPQG